VREALAKQGSPSDGRLVSLLNDFPAVWAMLEQRERVAVVRLYVGEVEYEGIESSVVVHFHPIESLAGHEHIAPGRKQVPGPGFDWAFLQQGLDWPDRYFPSITLPDSNGSNPT
jgi:hypothetical protein